MSVTIKKIAELCGVSRGTVDRVLNNRGNVKKETEEKIRQIAEQLNYTPNIAAKSLAVKKKAMYIGIIIVSDGNSFFDDILKGIYQAQRDLSDYGVNVIIKTMKGYSVDTQLEIIDSIKDDINALILHPITDIRIEKKINQLVDSGLPVSTINNDIETSKRLFYIGSNYTKGGETAAGMLGLITGGKANIGILTGSNKISGHNKRIAGFKNICQQKFRDFNILAAYETNDDEVESFDVTKRMLVENPEIDSIFIVGAGVYGACKAVISLGLESKMSIICYDRVPTTIEMMNKGIIKATICQQPFTQGNRSIHTMFNYLVSGARPEKVQLIVKNEIRILENI